MGQDNNSASNKKKEIKNLPKSIWNQKGERFSKPNQMEL